MTSSRWQRLGTVVTAERVRRGYRSLASFASSTGLSTSTLDSIEHGRKTSYDPSTIAALELALGWQAGSVERVLNGLEPLPDSDPDLTAVVDAWPHLSAGTKRVLAILATEASKAEK